MPTGLRTVPPLPQASQTGSQLWGAGPAAGGLLLVSPGGATCHLHLARLDATGLRRPLPTASCRTPATCLHRRQSLTHPQHFDIEHGEFPHPDEAGNLLSWPFKCVPIQVRGPGGGMAAHPGCCSVPAPGWRPLVRRAHLGACRRRQLYGRMHTLWRSSLLCHCPCRLAICTPGRGAIAGRAASRQQQPRCGGWLAQPRERRTCPEERHAVYAGYQRGGAGSGVPGCSAVACDMQSPMVVTVSLPLDLRLGMRLCQCLMVIRPRHRLNAGEAGVFFCPLPMPHAHGFMCFA